MAKETRKHTVPNEASKLVTPGRAAFGLAAAAAAAYGVYLLGAPTGQRRPVTELSNALGLRVRYVLWDGGHYAFYTRPGTGRPLVFLHSINAAAAAHEMRPLIKRFQTATDRPLFALEWLGFGHSDRPDVEYTADLLEDQLEHWLEQVVRPENGADVIALSLGAAYAAGIARRRPDLVHSLVAIEPAGLGDGPSAIAEGWAKLLFTLPGVQRAFYDRLTTPEALERFAGAKLFTPEFGVPKEFVDFGAETARVQGAARPLDDFLSGRLFPKSGRDAYLRMSQPLLIIHGTVQSRRMEGYTDLPALAARANATVAAVATGALPHWERTEDVMERIEAFYAQLSAAPVPV